MKVGFLHAWRLPNSRSSALAGHWRGRRLLVLVAALAASMLGATPPAQAGLMAALSDALARDGIDPSTVGLPPMTPSLARTTMPPQPQPNTLSFTWGFERLDQSLGGAELNGFVSQELWIDTPGVWLGAQIRIALDEGTIFHDEFHGTEFTSGRPADALIDLKPSLEFDTHVGRDDGGEVFVAGGAINLGGAPEPEVDSNTFDIAWATSPGDGGTGRLGLGRFTLSDNAAGRAAALLSAGDAGYELVTHFIEIDHGRMSSGEPILHGLDADFRPLPPPPPPPEPLILRGMTSQETRLSMEEQLGLVALADEGVPQVPISGAAPLPEPSSGPLALLLLAAVAVRHHMVRRG